MTHHTSRPATLTASPSAQHFAAPLCHNCGAALAAAWCGSCGQQRARRLNLLSVGSEAWSNFRLFELEIVRGALRLIAAPGLVAREFVLGARKKHVHPLKLLLIAAGILLLVLSQSNYLDSRNAKVSRAMELVAAYANWSFSLGILAILIATWTVLSWRRPWNVTEHLVLAVYCHFLIIVASILYYLPTLVWRAPAFLAMHKVWGVWYIDAVGILVLTLACKQFFSLDWRRQGWQLVLTAAVFVGCKYLLVRLYAIALVEIVLSQFS